MPIFLHGSANTAAWLFSANDIPQFGIMPLALLTVMGVILAILILIFAGKDLKWSVKVNEN
jgi:hypothetical protein